MFGSSAATHAEAAANNIANVNKQIILFMESLPVAIFLRLKQEDFGDEWPQLDPVGRTIAPVQSSSK